MKRLVLAGIVLLSALLATAGHEPARAAEVPIAITLNSYSVERSPITQVVQPGDTIKWTSAALNAHEDFKKIRITLTAVDSNPFVDGKSYDSGLIAIGADIPASPVVRAEAANARPNVYQYLIRFFQDNGVEIQTVRETKNFIWVPGAMDNTVRVRGLFACATVDAAFCSNANHLRNVISDGTTTFGTNWDARPRVLDNNPTAKDIVNNISGAGEITSAFAGADDNDLSVLYVTGHGNEKGEGAIKLGEWIRGKAFGYAGEIGAALNQVRGNKLMVFDACLSGNMIGGRTQPPIANSVVVTATDAKTKSSLSNKGVFGHPHTFLGGSLVSGLMRVKPIGPSAQPVAGVVAADPSPGAADPAVRVVSVRRWFDFAKDQIGQIVALAAPNKKLAGEALDPETARINDDFSPVKASDLIIFQYNKGTINGAELHVDPPASADIESTCEECPTDVCPAEVGGTTELLVGGGDAPASAAGGGSDGPYAAGGAALALVALFGGGWYVRRRWVRRRAA